jgi:hypothetical protein
VPAWVTPKWDHSSSGRSFGLRDDLRIDPLVSTGTNRGARKSGESEKKWQSRLQTQPTDQEDRPWVRRIEPWFSYALAV